MPKAQACSGRLRLGSQVLRRPDQPFRRLATALPLTGLDSFFWQPHAAYGSLCFFSWGHSFSSSRQSVPQLFGLSVDACPLRSLMGDVGICELLYDSVNGPHP